MSEQARRFVFDDGALTVLCDGQVNTSREAVTGIAPDRLDALLAQSEAENPLQPAIAVLLVELDGRRTLIDTGAGPSMGAAAGHLVARLAEVGIMPADIDTILLTHIHPDHSNGLIDAQGASVYPHAELVAHKADLTFWTGSDPAAAEPRFRRNMENARRAIAPYRDRLHAVADGAIHNGFQLVWLPGHTPGHSGWRFTIGGKEILVLGDLVHLAAVQIPEPAAGLRFDVDPDAARATRVRLLAQVSAEETLVFGAHMPFPGFARIESDETGFSFVSVEP